MSLLWVRNKIETSQSASGLVSNTLVYSNQIEGTASRRKDKVTVVSHYLWGVTNTVEGFSLRPVVVHEDFPTLSVSIPPIDDDKTKGMYLFAQGPVMYNPRRLISIPPEHIMYLQLVKEFGSAASVINIFYGFLLQITD